MLITPYAKITIISIQRAEYFKLYQNFHWINRIRIMNLIKYIIVLNNTVLVLLYALFQILGAQNLLKNGENFPMN